MSRSEGDVVDGEADPDPAQPEPVPPDPAELMVTMGSEGEELEEPPDQRPDLSESLEEPLWQRPTVRAGAYAWAIIGMAILAVVLGLIIAQLSAVIIPLVIALFPAAVMQPASDKLKASGWPDWAAALSVLLATIGVLTGVVTFIAPQVGNQLEALGESITMGYQQLDRFLASG
ncbi:MAG TPA: AI-2E family transporter, partial [Euzebya sp.]|nr:AI-2E family transporter [Euzebya sp.]